MAGSKLCAISSILARTSTAVTWCARRCGVATARRVAVRTTRIRRRAQGGRTPLWYASKYGHRLVVRALLDAGADKTIAPAAGAYAGKKPLGVVCEGYFNEDDKVTVRTAIEAMLDPEAYARKMKAKACWSTARKAGSLRNSEFEDLAVDFADTFKMINEFDS